MIELVVATANPDKLIEFQQILSGVVTLLPRPSHVPDVVEDGETLLDNARLKAAAIVAATGQPAVADDTGLEVDALDGAPGVWSARYAGEDATYADNVTKLLGALKTVDDPDRGAQFRTVVVVQWPDGREIRAEGIVRGTIGRVRRGESGFGYDPVFTPDEADGRTFAQMASEEKHAISHRGRAFAALLDQLT